MSSIIESSLVKCRFLDTNKEPKGREYTYIANEPVEIGEIVTTQDGKEVVITELNISREAVAGFEDKLKYISKGVREIEPEQDTLSFDEIIDIDFTQTEETFKPQELIIVEQLPIITERLAALSTEIDKSISEALALDCSEKTKQIVKKTRSRLNKNFLELEERRKIVKKAIEEPYKQFEAIYKQYVSDKYTDADRQLKDKIDTVETEQKSRLKSDAELYFNEYLVSKNIDFVTFENSNIKVGVSDNLTNLKKQAKAFIDKVSDDVALIETQEHKEEIFVEYKKTLNCSQAITAVVVRHKAIEEQKQRQAEQEARKAAEQEVVKKVEAALPVQPIAPPVEMPVVEVDPVRTLSFRVTASILKLKELKKFLEDGGYQYE